MRQAGKFFKGVKSMIQRKENSPEDSKEEEKQSDFETEEDKDMIEVRHLGQQIFSNITEFAGSNFFSTDPAKQKADSKDLKNEIDII